MDDIAASSFDRHVSKGLACRERHDLHGAILEFDAACRLRPEAVGATCELAFTHLQAGSIEDAQALYTTVYRQDGANLAALTGLAHVSRLRGEPDLALTYLRKAAALEPLKFAVQFELADLLRSLGLYDESRAVFRGVVLQDPTQWNAWVGLALLARQRSDHAVAAALFQQAVEVHSYHLGIQLELAFSLRLAGLMGRATQCYREILERDPVNTDALLGLAGILRHEGQPAHAAEYLEAAVAQRPADVNMRLEFAAALRESMRLDRADIEYQIILQTEPQDWRAISGRGVVARQRGDHAGSLAHFQFALALKPDDEGLHSELALTLRLMDRLDEAEAIYQQGLASNPRSAGPIQGMGLIALARGNLDTAIHWAREALLAEPANLDRMTFLAALYRDSGDLTEAQRQIERCLALASDHAPSWVEAGLQRRMRDDRHGALDAFLKAATLNPAYGWIDAAAEHRALGNPESARAIYQRVLANLPKHFGALLGLAELEMLAGEYDRCIALCDSLIETYPDTIAPYRQKCRALIQLDRADEAVCMISALTSVGPSAAEADAARLEIFRTCGMRQEAEALLALSRVTCARAFGLWFEVLLTRLAFFDLGEATHTLQAAPAVRPFEKSRVMYGQGVLADLEWRLGDAISWFEQALRIHADDPGAHHQLARLHLLKADADGTHRHLRAMIDRSASALSMRGESTNVSQNLIGQLLNELRLDTDMAARLAARSNDPPTVRVDAHIAEVRQSPASTPAAASLMLALRQVRAFQGIDPDSAGEPASSALPRKIMQYWDQTQPPKEIARLMRAWAEAHPDFAYSRFDNRTAREYLLAHYPVDVLNAYRLARHPAQASDLFRLAYLAREGGFYIDADDRCVGSLSLINAPEIHLVTYQEQYATLGNNFLGCVPGEPVITRALNLAVESLNRGDAEAIWLATGPGLLTRVFAQVLSQQGGEWRSWLKLRRVLDRNELSKISWSHCISQYKNTGRSWLKTMFKAARAAPG